MLNFFYFFFCLSYNKRQDDFEHQEASLRSYNDYLEEVETIGMLAAILLLNYLIHRFAKLNTHVQ